MADATFAGFPPEAFAFFEGLESDNSKTYWTANAPVWAASVKGPMEALLASLEGGPEAFNLFRMNRDLRFSKDKSPYKTMLGAVADEGGVVRYLHLSARGLLAATGTYLMAKDQLERYRKAVDDDRAGADLEGIVADVTQAGLQVGAGGENVLTTAPRGYPRDHPRIELLRWKGAIASAETDDPAVVGSAAAPEWVEGIWRVADPLNRWLGEHVGESTLPPPPDGRR